uniref:Uncharacterized protein n=1 Tax=Rhizophora mucronata TaxID=61149 RepID=A0A2P2M6L5_RHIMU
MLYELTLYC